MVLANFHETFRIEIYIQKRKIKCKSPQFTELFYWFANDKSVCLLCVCFLCALDFQIKLFPSIHFSLNTVFCLIEWQHEKCKYITVCLTFCYMPISLQYFTLSRFIRHYFMFLQIAQTRYANVHQLYVAKIKQQHNNSRVIRQSQHNESIYTWTSV